MKKIEKQTRINNFLKISSSIFFLTSTISILVAGIYFYLQTNKKSKLSENRYYKNCVQDEVCFYLKTQLDADKIRYVLDVYLGKEFVKNDNHDIFELKEDIILNKNNKKSSTKLDKLLEKRNLSSYSEIYTDALQQTFFTEFKKIINSNPFVQINLQNSENFLIQEKEIYFSNYSRITRINVGQDYFQGFEIQGFFEKNKEVNFENYSVILSYWYTKELIETIRANLINLQDLYETFPELG